MAYPAVTAPYGFRAVNSVDGKPYAGATRQLKIRATNYGNGGLNGPASPIFYGDLVIQTSQPEADTGARIQRLDGNQNAINSYGVFMGCTYTNPTTKQPTFSQYWPGPTAAPDAMAYIIDDPMAMYKVVPVNYDSEAIDSTAIVPAGYYSIGMQLPVTLVWNGDAGNTNTGNSYMGVVSPANWLTFPAYDPRRVLVVDVVPETQTDSGYVELYVKLVNAFLGSDAPNDNDGPLLT